MNILCEGLSELYFCKAVLADNEENFVKNLDKSIYYKERCLKLRIKKKAKKKTNLKISKNKLSFFLDYLFLIKMEIPKDLEQEFYFYDYIEKKCISISDYFAYKGYFGISGFFVDMAVNSNECKIDIVKKIKKRTKLLNEHKIKKE